VDPFPSFGYLSNVNSKEPHTHKLKEKAEENCLEPEIANIYDLNDGTHKNLLEEMLRE